MRDSGHATPALQPERPRAARIALWGFAAVAAYFLWTEHRAHVVQFLPWILVGLCPLMHFFMHGGSHDHAQHSARGVRDRTEDEEK